MSAHPQEELPWHMKSYQDFLASPGTNKRLLGKLEQVLIATAAERDSHRDTLHIHPSEISKESWCPRQTYYKIIDTAVSDPESFRFQRLNIFEEGHQIHDKWQTWMWRAGILEGDWKCLICDHKWWARSPSRCPECLEPHIRYAEVPILDDAHRILGHADGQCTDAQGTYLVELKSVGLGTIRFDAPNLYKAYEDKEIDMAELWKRIKRPLSAHNRQIQTYMHCTGIHEAAVIYEWKPDQSVKEFWVKYSPETVAPLLDGCDEIIHALDVQKTPARHPDADSSSSKVCTFCPYKKKCWGGKP